MRATSALELVVFLHCLRGKIFGVDNWLGTTLGLEVTPQALA